MIAAYDTSLDYSAAKKIVLGGATYLVPPLVLRQTVVIGPMLPAVMKMNSRRASALAKLAPSEYDAANAEAQSALAEALVLSEDEMMTALKVIVAGLSRAYRGVALDDLLELPISQQEIVEALGVVLAQTGIVKPREANELIEEPEAGKAEATNL